MHDAVLKTEDREEDKIPKSFPGVLMMNPNMKQKPFLHDQHREYGKNGNAEFEHFVKHLLACIHPRRTKFKCANQRCTTPMNQAFTASDEAFGLMALANELHVWDEQMRLKKEDINIKRLSPKHHPEMCKKHTVLHAKQQCGWTQEGKLYYKLLEHEVHAARKAKEGSEEKFMLKFQREVAWKSSGNYKKPTQAQNTDDDTFATMHNSMPFLEKMSWTIAQATEMGYNFQLPSWQQTKAPA